MCSHDDAGAWVRRRGKQVIVDWPANHPVSGRSWAFDFPNEQEAHGCWAAFEEKLRTGKDVVKVLS